MNKIETDLNVAGIKSWTVATSSLVKFKLIRNGLAVAYLRYIALGL